MITMIKAVYEDGVLKPTEPLELPERSEVRMLVLACNAAVKATYEGGVLKPEDPLFLEEHSQVEVVVQTWVARCPDDPTGWKAIDRLIGVAGGEPSDASERHDDCLYGDPHK